MSLLVPFLGKPSLFAIVVFSFGGQGSLRVILAVLFLPDRCKGPSPVGTGPLHALDRTGFALGIWPDWIRELGSTVAALHGTMIVTVL